MILNIKKKFLIKPREEFWGHCSNLQAWIEFDYHPELLHSSLTIPILKRLALYDKKYSFHYYGILTTCL